MESTRLQRIDNETRVEVTETKTVKRVFREDELLRQKAYFEGMIAKGQEGLERVEELLTQITNAN